MMVSLETQNPARIASGAGFLVSVCAFAPSGRGPAPPGGKQRQQGKQQARQSAGRREVRSVSGLELHHGIAAQGASDCQPHCKKKLG